jgi:hypothetical protein
LEPPEAAENQIADVYVGQLLWNEQGQCHALPMEHA